MENNSFNSKEKDWLTTLLLCIFVGTLGIHRFYVGKTITGIIMLLTLGGCGIWTLIDFVLIVTDVFTDVNGQPLKKDKNIKSKWQYVYITTYFLSHINKLYLNYNKLN